MAISAHIAFPHMLALLLTFLAISFVAAAGCYTSLFIFGDSYNDVGNFEVIDKTLNIDRLPYGMTYFGHPTGRFCDGRNIPDFIAEAFGLPYPPPFLRLTTSGQDLRRGVNYAIAGATVLDPSFFIERGLVGNWSDYRLSVQIRMFRELLPSLCSSESECRDFMGSSLFSLGQIGSDDFVYFLMQGRNVTEVTTYVPYVVDALTSTVKELIGLGAKTLLVPGIFPLGCLPEFLTFYSKLESMTKDDYDPITGCLWKMNQLSEFYDLQLQAALDQLREQNPQITIIYANLYRASMMILESPEKFGFDKPTLRVCCGGGGPYNFNESAKCGAPGSTVCDDPSRAVFWIRYHFTEAANRIIATSILEGPNAVPPIAHSCQKIIKHDQDLMLNVY